MITVITNLIRINPFLIIVALSFFGVLGCAEKTEEKTRTAMKPVFDRKKVDRGFIVYSANCQTCHGVMAKGAPNWREPDADGKYPPPPLNGSGHSWHHPRKLLKEMISNGTQPQGNMPAWKDKLSDEEIDNVITWFQSIWPPQVYHAWREIDNR